MKLSSAIALLALPAATEAFAPSNVAGRNNVPSAVSIGTSPTVSALSMAVDNDDDNNMSPGRIAQSAMTTFTASVLLASSVLGGPTMPASSAYAASAAAPAPATTTAKAAPAKKEAPVDPLASEKKAVADAKARVSGAQGKSSAATKAAADAAKAEKKDADGLSSAEKKARKAKETLLDANNKLANAKAKGKTTDLKQVEQLGAKVGK